MIDWNEIDTVLLDMDGTILDLHFDNYFWQEYLPVYWGKLNGMDEEAAKAHLLPEFRKREGTLSWYCLDFWSAELNIDILKLKNDIVDRIRIRPSALSFLEALVQMDKAPVMVTNAHHDLIDLKMQKTGIDRYFEAIVHSHRLGTPKEEPEFWSLLHDEIPFDPQRTLLIDDNLKILRTAQAYGILYLFSISRPDSRAPERDTGEFPAIRDFSEILTGFYSSANTKS